MTRSRTSSFALSIGLFSISGFAFGQTAQPLTPQNPLQTLRERNRALTYVIPDKPELSSLYFDGNQIEVQTEERWRFMCGSDLTGLTFADLKAIADAHRAKFDDVIIIDGNTRGAGIDIIFSTDSSVPAGALSGFALAETYIEGLFSDPITVSVTCSFANLGSGVIGATGSFYVSGVSWTNSRNGLTGGKDADDTIQDFLPTGTTIPVRFNGSSSTITNQSTVSWTRANYRAAVGTASGSAGSMTYNSTFSFDYDPSNGVSGTSFVDVVCHETGHALGFTSAADGSGFEALDIYRFQRTATNPSTTAEFQTFSRLVDFNNPNDDANSDLVTVEYRMSDGDPYQASHFREQIPNIGLMDPAISGGVTFYPNYFKASDIAMFDAIGYNYPACTAPIITTQPAAFQAVCSGDFVTLSVATSAILPTYQWRKGSTNLVDGPNLAGTTGPVLVILSATAADAATNYNCVVSASSCPVTSNDAQIDVGSSPVITVQPNNQTVSAGGLAFFTTATSEPAILFSFQWRRGGVNLADGPNIVGAQTSFLAILAAEEADEGSYDCVVTRLLGGCDSVTTAATLTVNSCTPPEITTQPAASQTLCQGSSVSLTTGTSGVAPTYQWRRGLTDLVDGPNVTGAASATLTILSATPADSGVDYNCLITAGGCTNTSNNAAITVNAPPAITTQPGSELVCEGVSASLSVATSALAPTYQWRRGTTDLVDDANVSGATTALLTLLSPTGADTGSDYNCVVTVAGCTTVSDNGTITVEVNPVLTLQPSNATVNEGDAAVFSVDTSEPQGEFTFQWRRNAVDLSDGGTVGGSDTPALMLTGVTPADAGSYDCVVRRSSAGCVTISDSASLTVNAPPGCPNPQDACDRSDIFPTGAADCVVNLSDLGIVLANYAPGVGGMTRDQGDVFGNDGFVDLSDLGQVLADFGVDCR